MNHSSLMVVGLAGAGFGMLPALVQAAPVVVREDVFKSAPQTGAPRPAKIAEGAAALDRADLAAAEAAFTAALQSDPKQALAYIGLAEVAGRRRDRAALDQWIKKALAALPDDATVLSVWGNLQFKRGQFGDAEVTLKKAVAAEPASAALRLQLAENYLLGLKKPQLAEEAYLAALSAQPGNVDAQLGLGASMAAQRRTEDTVAAFEKAATMAPLDPRPTHSLARYYGSQLKFDQAIAALDRTLAIDPAFLPAHLDKGDLLMAKNEPEAAAQAFVKATQAVKAPAMAYFRLGVVYEGLGRPKDAEQAYLEAVKADPAMYGAYNNMAFSAANRKERLDDALAWAQKAIALAPKNMTLQDTLGWVHRARGELEPAAKAIQKAVADNPKQASFRYHLGLVYADQGKKKEAAAELQKALELNKNFRYAADAQERLKLLASR